MPGSILEECYDVTLLINVHGVAAKRHTLGANSGPFDATQRIGIEKQVDHIERLESGISGSCDNCGGLSKVRSMLDVELEAWKTS